MRSRPAVRGAQDVVDDVGLVGQFLVDHHGKDAHLRSTAVVELNRALLKLGLLGQLLPLLLKRVDARHVAGEGSLLLLHDEELQESHEEDDLGDTEGAHLMTTPEKGVGGRSGRR